MLTTQAETLRWLNDNIESSRRKGVMRSLTAKMTPVAANVILEKFNERNRPFKPATISKVESAIAGGRWRLTSQGISFSASGILNNGQNRLRAIANSGIAVPIQVTFGEDEGAFEVIDTDMSPRSAADVTALLGYKNSTNLAAAARLLSIVESGRPMSNASLPNHAVAKFLAERPGLESAVAVGGNVRKAKKSFVASGVSVAIYLINRDTKNPSRLPEFIEKLGTGAGLDAKCPILKLRSIVENQTLDQGFRDTTTRTVAQSLSIVKTWNAYISGHVGRKNTVIWDRSEAVPIAK